MALEGIEHRSVEVNGIKMHVAEKGEGPVVLLLHGFPELWYSWRHQINFLASRGFRAVAPDLRGYGDTEAPTDVSAYSIFHLVGDIVALIDSLGQEQVFVVGHDWGAVVAWNLCAFRPDKVKALVNLSVAYLPRYPAVKPIDAFRASYGDDFYICKFQEPELAESLFSQLGVSFVLKMFYTLRDPKPLILSKEGTLPGYSDKETFLPSWLSEDDLSYFSGKFNKSGFTGGLGYYRNFNRNWELTAPWLGAQIRVPVRFIVGDLDLAYNFKGRKEYIHNGEFKRDVPLLDEVVVLEGVGHFINQERPEDVSNHIFDFFQKVLSTSTASRGHGM